MEQLREILVKMIAKCKDERDVDNRSEILREINSMLPQSHKIRIPSLITNDYISMALYRIEKRLLVTA